MARQPLAAALLSPVWLEQQQKASLVSDHHLRHLLHEERARFFNILAKTSFPALLTWRLPALARRLFQVFPNGDVSANSRYLHDRKAAKQAGRVCFGYAVAALPRLTPRQAWVGQGFAQVLETQQKSASITQEILHVEPDIGWFAKAFPVLGGTPLLAGDDGWDWLLRAFRNSGLYQASCWVAESRDCWRDVAMADFASSLQLQASLHEQLKEFGFRSELGQGWWATRLLPREITLPAMGLQMLDTGLGSFFTKGSQINTSNFATLPLVWLIAQASPEDVWGKAEEFWNWVVEQDTLHAPRLAQEWQQLKQSALLAEFTGRQVRLLGFDPSPARSTSRASRLMPFKPSFNDKFTSRPLKIPNNILDNRVIRPQVQEYIPEEINATDEAEVRTTLMTDAIWSLFTRELKSPRYTHTPDLPPQYVDFKHGIPLPFGRLSANGRYLLLHAHTLPDLVTRVKNPLGLARLLGNWNPLFLETAWLDVLIGGKKCCFYTGCGLGFDWLLAQLANVVHQQPIFISIPAYPFADSPLTDAEGNGLDALILLLNFRSE